MAEKCLLCGREFSKEGRSGGICGACSDSVRSEAAGRKSLEKRQAEEAIRSSGQKTEPKPPKQ